MTLDTLRRLCLSLPGATEEIQWGADLVFKVAGKMFCVACTEKRTEGVALSFKCDPETYAEMLERDGVVPAPYLARAKWVGLERFDALPAGELQRLIEQSYALVVARLPKSARARLTPPGS